MMTRTKRKPKKSETLEVRVSLETKDALREKAHAEGRTISRIVRNLIEDYIFESNKRAQPKSCLESPHKIRSNFISKPRFMFLVFSFTSAVAILFGSMASANAIQLDFNGEFIKTEEDGNTFVKNVQYKLKGNSDEKFTIDFDLAEKRISIIMIASKATISEENDGIRLFFELRENIEGEDIVVATPVLFGSYGDDFTVQIDKGEGISYNWKVRPQL